MTRFEKYLLDQGFKRMVRLVNDDLVEAETDHYSLLGYKFCVYAKDEERIYFGLHEKYKPPTLIYPRPRIKSKEVTPWSDDAMNRVLTKYEPKEIFKGIYDQSIIFEV